MHDKLRPLCISVDNSLAVYINQHQIELACDIGVIINKVKLEGQLEDTYDYDIKSKSKITQAMK
ncbi:MAG: hypothetical protein WAK17_14055 [Candidatus Nitrosopolaris sp.]|jgi:hypothetical protein